MTSQSILLYILKSGLLSGIFVGYYWLALRNKRFHYFNRFYLLTAMALSLIVPALRFDWVTNEKPVFMGSGEVIDIIVNSRTPETYSIGIWDISLMVAALIALILITMVVYHIIRIYKLKKQSSITRMPGFDLMHTDEASAPFSFMDNLFWKKSISLEAEGGKQIFKHELTHIQQKHTWDRLFTQLISSLFWMNPFYWIIQKELVAIHEFIADEAAVVNQDVESFAKMLLQVHYGNHFLETKHSFFYSSIKRRLTMLTTTTNTRFSYLRRVMLLPILLISISIFSVRVHAKEKIEDKLNAISERIFQERIDTTKPPPPPPSLNEKIKHTRALVLVNGKEANKAELANTLKPNEVTNVKFLSPEDGLKKYGDRGKYGAIEITKGKSIAKKKETMQLKSTSIDSTKYLHLSEPVTQTSKKESFDVIFTVAQEPASFPGGPGAWLKYLERNLNRDKPVEKGAPPGVYRVDLSFIVDQDGDIRDVVAKTNPGYFTKDEAIRVLLSSPKWIPAKQNGHNVSSLVEKSIAFGVSEE